MTRMKHLLLAATFGLATCLPATAQTIGRSAADVVQVTILPGYRISEDRHIAGIRITLAPGWKTYWRSPGDGGVPTVLRLTDVDGVTGMAIHWPSPEVFFNNGMRSIGYRDDVVLPVEFELSTDGSARIDGFLEMGVCLDVCMPITVDVAATLPPETSRDGAIAGALADRPYTAVEAGATAPTCSVEPISDGLRVTMRMETPDVGNDETIVLEHRDPMIWVSEAVSEREGSWITAVADVVPADHGPFALNRSDLRITVIGTRMAIDLGTCSGG